MVMAMIMTIPKMMPTMWLFFFFFFFVVQMKFHVIRRSDNQLLPVSLETDPTVCFHFVNCFEVRHFPSLTIGRRMVMMTDDDGGG